MGSNPTGAAKGNVCHVTFYFTEFDGARRDMSLGIGIRDDQSVIAVPQTEYREEAMAIDWMTKYIAEHDIKSLMELVMQAIERNHTDESRHK